MCAGKQGAEAFWAMHEILFERVQEWGGAENELELFEQYADELGLDTDAFAACLLAGEMGPQVLADTELGRSMGVGGTPAFFVNDWFISGAQDYQVFQDTIERALRGEHPPPTPTPLPEGATAFDPNPERPGYTYGGDATRGSPDAELLLLQFVDFASGANREFFVGTGAQLEKDYVEPGKVRLLVKHFPADGVAAAAKAAEAAECAGNQDAFWAMYDLLFERQAEWSASADVSAAFAEYAAELDLDVELFAACLDEGQTADKVAQDVAIATRNQLGPAPQFVVFFGDQAGIVDLENLLDVFQQLLQE
jgi:protein-disulfide isomerase